MAEEGKLPFDPTTTEGAGAGAEGGAVGGDSAGDGKLPPPLQPPPDIDRTNPFEPGGTSTPYPPPENDREAMELSNMNLDETEFDPDDTPLLTNVMYSDEQKTFLEKGLKFIKSKFAKVDFKKLGPVGFSKKTWK